MLDRAMKFLTQNYVKYGLLMTGIIALCLTYMEVSGQNDSFDKPPLVMAAIFFAPVVIWYLGINAKKKMLKGKMSFKQGFAEGFKISLVYGTVSPFIFLFYYLVVNPSIVDYVRKAYNMNGASDINVIVIDLVTAFITAIIMGTILSTVVSLFLRSKKK